MYKCASLHQLINAWRNKYQGVSKLCEGAIQLFFFAPRAGSLDE
jgi:hypothetical protein